MKIYVYIDGFNLYYGCLKNTSYLWLDILKMCKFRFPQDEIIKIKYFTAPIKARMDDKDPDRPNRQQIYLRALRTLSNLEIIEGIFLRHEVSMKLAKEEGYALVIKHEEKGTDVKQIRKGLLRVSQFTEKLTDEVGEFSIPEKWKLIQKTP